MFLYVKTFSKCNTCNDREPDVPVSSGRGGSGIGGGEMVCRRLGKIGRKRSRGTSPCYVLRMRTIKRLLNVPIGTRKRGHEISGGLKSGLRRKGNALNLNADDNISGESLDDTNEKPSTRNLWGSEINY